MHLTYHTIDLNLKHPFRISRSVSESRKNIIVEIEGGIGEAAPSPYYGDNAETVIEYLVWGLDIGTVKEGLKVSLDTITRIPGITRISSFNQGGLWGKHKIYLRDLLDNPRKPSDRGRL
jgi:hypothetical protein